MYWRLKEMKKLIASLLVLVFGATMVIAEVPVPGAETPQTVTVSPEDFSDVEGVGLDENDSSLIMGRGGVQEISGGVKISINTPIVKYEAYVNVTYKNPKTTNNSSSSNNSNKIEKGERAGNGHLTK
jgi:hypothetical protein